MVEGKEANKVVIEGQKTRFRELLNLKKDKLEKNLFDPLREASELISNILKYIDGKIELSPPSLANYLDTLVGNYTLFLDHPINAENKLVRGRVKGSNIDELYSNIDELSYNKNNNIIKVGRLNVAKQSLFYGGFYLVDENEVQNIIFSEIEAQKDDNVYLLYSKISRPIQLRYIGMWARCFYGLKPQGLDNIVFDYYNDLYSLMEDELSTSEISIRLFNSIVLTDKFLHDVITRKKNGRLYDVTSLIANQLLENKNIDGIWYSAVRAFGAPLVALKPESVDNKLQFIKSEYYKILDDYGYALYQAKLLKRGTFYGRNILWQ